MSEHLGAFRKEVIEKLAGLTGRQYIAANPGQHLWATYNIGESCAFCGIMRNYRGDNHPCKGMTKIVMRDSK